MESHTEVIVLSDDTEKLPTDVPRCYELPAGDEEVNSPVMLPPRTVRRKLFNDELEVPDRESTTQRGPCFIDLATDGQVRTMIQQDRVVPKPPPFKADACSPSTRSPHTSSCASNSPIVRYPQLVRRPNI